MCDDFRSATDPVAIREHSNRLSAEPITLVWPKAVIPVLGAIDVQARISGLGTASSSVK
jgi:hypothetical protein